MISFLTFEKTKKIQNKKLPPLKGRSSFRGTTLISHLKTLTQLYVQPTLFSRMLRSEMEIPIPPVSHYHRLPEWIKRKPLFIITNDNIKLL